MKASTPKRRTMFADLIFSRAKVGAAAVMPGRHQRPLAARVEPTVTKPKRPPVAGRFAHLKPTYGPIFRKDAIAGAARAAVWTDREAPTAAEPLAAQHIIASARAAKAWPR